MGSTVQYLLISNCASGGPGSGKITHCEQLSRNGLLSPHPLQSPEPQLPPCQPWQQICQDSPIFKHRPFGTITVFNVNFLLAIPKLLRVGCNHKKAHCQQQMVKEATFVKFPVLRSLSFFGWLRFRLRALAPAPDPALAPGVKWH